RHITHAIRPVRDSPPAVHDASSTASHDPAGGAQEIRLWCPPTVGAAGRNESPAPPRRGPPGAGERRPPREGYDMTLDTRIYVLDQVDAHDVFHHMRSLLGATDEHTYTDKQRETWRNGEGFVEPGSEWHIGNDPGQGLPAWLIVDYRPG